MDRLSPLDATFLYIEDDNNPMHIGSITVFEGPPPTYGELVRLVAAKLALVPRYRQRVRFVPFGLGRPVWVDDPHFNLLYHIRRTGLPAPGGREELRNLAGRLFGQSLDRAKPLWELWMVEGLADQGGSPRAGSSGSGAERGTSPLQKGWALISKVHHAMVDGVSGTDLMTVLFDLEPEPPPQRPTEWRPAQEPGSLRLLLDTAMDSVTDPLARLRGLPVLARANLAGIGGRELRNFLYTMGQFLQPAAVSLNGPIGPHRRWSWASTSLDEIKEVRRTFGGTVNDVVLTAITRGFRDLLIERGEDVDGKVVRTLVPVSVRSEDERGTYNNRVSALFPGLPVGIADPLERLEAIRIQMEGFKESRQAVAGDVLVNLSGFAAPMLLDLAARLALRFEQNWVQTVTTNVPGPQFPLFVAGRKMTYAYPYVPIAGTVRIGIAIFSYLGGVNFGVTGDFDSVPDLETLTAGIEAGIAELREAAATTAPAPERPAHRPRKRSTRSRKRAVARAS